MQNLVETQVEAQLFFHNGYQDINGDRHPDLNFHGVLGGSIKSLDAQMLFDPSEEQFHLPASPIKLRDGQSWKEEVVGQENEPRVFFGIEVVNPSQGVGIESGALRSGQPDGLIGRIFPQDNELKSLWFRGLVAIRGS